MIIQVRFGAAQTGLGYQFFDSGGVLLDARVTAGIAALPETGGYVADATVPTGAVGVYWDSDAAEASEDLREALAGAASDPWLTTVPGAYAAGTAGYAVGRLNIAPADAPVVVIPDPSDDATLCVVHVDASSTAGVAAAGVVVRFSFDAGPAKAGFVLTRDDVLMTLDAAGRGTVTLHRNDLITPAGSRYLVSCAELRLEAVPLELETETYDLANLIT